MSTTAEIKTRAVRWAKLCTKRGCRGSRAAQDRMYLVAWCNELELNIKRCYAQNRSLRKKLRDARREIRLRDRWSVDS